MKDLFPYTYILGVRVHKIKKEQIPKILTYIFKTPRLKNIYTPNPEIILKAQKDKKFFEILNRADLALADGNGLKLGAKISKDSIPDRITGVDFSEQLIAEAAKLHKSVFFLGGTTKTAQLAAEALKKKYPDLKIAGTLDGEKFNQTSSQKICQIINSRGAKVVLVALGAPKQEKWIDQNSRYLKQTQVIIGVGGAFDFWSGKIKRAPQSWQKLNLEWLWRLLQQPTRIKRILNAVIVFPLKTISWRLRVHFLYRPNVVCFILKDNKVLLMERSFDPGHWQLPQGGVDPGESFKKAFIRESFEEVGLKDFKILGVKKKVHQYKWVANRYPDQKRVDPKYKHNAWLNRLHYGYKGQRQAVVLAEYLGTKEPLKQSLEISNSGWFTVKEALKKVHPVRRPVLSKTIEFYNKL